MTSAVRVDNGARDDECGPPWWFCPRQSAAWPLSRPTSAYEARNPNPDGGPLNDVTLRTNAAALMAVVRDYRCGVR